MTVLTLGGNEIDWADPPAPTAMVRWDRTDTGGDIVKGSLRTIAHIDTLNTKALRRFGAPFTIIQPPYNTGVPASAGTHDFDCCIDWYIPGVSWWTMQRFGRANGHGCWYRHPPLFGNHVHGFTLPIPEGSFRGDDFATRVGIFVPGQLIDYYNHAFGLSGQHTPGSDKSWFPRDIDATVFDLDRYITKQRELTMEYKDWSEASKRELVHDILSAPVNVRKMSGEGVTEVTLKQAIARAANAGVVVRGSEKDIIDAIKKSDETNRGGE